MRIVDNIIKKRLSNYKIQVNTVDENLPLKVSGDKSVAVVGAGIAGLTSSNITF